MSEDKEEAIKIEGISINKVKSDYKPFLAVAFCWTDNGEKGLFYDYVQPSFAVHPCDLFDENGEREVWKYLNIKEESIEEKLKKEKSEEETSKILEHFKNILPEKAKYLWNNIAGGIQVSNFGRVGIPINCNGKSGLCKGCKGCTLKCEKFHFILHQYENRFWDNSQQEFKTYNGYLVVDINGEERLVYELVAEAFEMKEKTFQKMKEDNKVLKNYIKEKCGFDDEEELESLKNANELQIHHIDNNGHHNTPTYWDENGTMIKGNLIALPEGVHNKIHGKSLKLPLQSV